MGKRLAVFTNTFPYGKGETFLEDEINFTAQEFEQIEIFPLYIPGGDDGQIVRKVPQNVQVHPPLLRSDHKDKKALLTDGLLNFAPIGFAMKEFIGKKIYSSKKKTWLWGTYLCTLRSILGNRARMGEILQTLEECSAAYFYWGDKSALAIPFLKRKLEKRPAFVVRFHGSDVYEEAKGFLPFREMLYKAVDYAVPISENGKEYI